jgi:hypothetical protein
MLAERALAPPGKFPPLLLFPEGTTANGRALLKFQRGIFLAAAPVQPVAVKFSYTFANSGWFDSTGLVTHTFQLLCSLFHFIVVKELPLYTPSEAEREDAILYADNVGQSVANELGIALSGKSMFDNPFLHIAHRVHPHPDDSPNTAMNRAEEAGGAEVRINVSPDSSASFTSAPSTLPAAIPRAASRQGWVAE